jgi:hypothetical protein
MEAAQTPHFTIDIEANIVIGLKASVALVNRIVPRPRFHHDRHDMLVRDQRP